MADFVSALDLVLDRAHFAWVSPGLRSGLEAALHARHVVVSDCGQSHAGWLAMRHGSCFSLTCRAYF